MPWSFLFLATGMMVASAGSMDRLSIVSVGDSLTHGVVDEVTQDEAYPALLGTRFAGAVDSVNSGVQGDSTAEMVARRASIAAEGPPDIVIIYGGTNDVGAAATVQAMPVPTDTVFAIEADRGGYYEAGGWIIVQGVQAQIQSVAGDLITLTAPRADGAPAAGATVAIDTERNLTELARYAQGFGAKVIIAGNHFWNFAVDGDTLETPLARNVTLRARQEAAANATGAVYVDLHDWMRQLIVDGVHAPGDDAWHSAPGDQHLNATGQAIVADALEDAIRKRGWAGEARSVDARG